MVRKRIAMILMAMVLASVVLIPFGEVRAATADGMESLGGGEIKMAAAVGKNARGFGRSGYITLANGDLHSASRLNVPASAQLAVPSIEKGESAKDTDAKKESETTSASTPASVKINTDSKALPAKAAYLTFDDGPSVNTTKILNILDRYNVKATFFVIYRPGYESTYKRIVSSGHTLALHSYSHRYKTIYKSEAAFYSDLDSLERYLESVTGTTPPKILRFPGGSNNTVSRKYSRGIMTTLTQSVKERGYRYYDWNVDSRDASEELASKSKIINSVRNGIGSRSQAMILMHDAPAKTTTVDALPEIITILKQKGYTILPITESTPEVHFKVAN